MNDEARITLVPTFVALPLSRKLGLPAFNVTLNAALPEKRLWQKILRETGSCRRTDSSRVPPSVQGFLGSNLFRSGQIVFWSGRYLHSYDPMQPNGYM
ncbi:MULTISPECIES: hypothetical protein [Burkholderia]|uniref:hypothetical protein n=1 Tax=Burkholderia TaxID=32008 RepID=UPI000F5945D1|nr:MULTISPECIES: hypothetical protein [Burkholderia]KAB0661937.1 hypothetical protein F7R23_04660 [Burkholderia diffusa]MBM2656982.1 hypothetical protein [Burkholderia diffusa]